MNWSPRHTLSAGLLLIALVNAVALGGAAYNRSGEPESTLSLSERELRPPYVWRGGKENSGLALRLQWRVPQIADRSNALYPFATYGGGIPDWLDASKMSSLGFDIKLSTENPDSYRGSLYLRQLPRDVLVVLELDGPAYREALDHVAIVARELEAKNERGEGKKDADELMKRESLRNSRLFAVDAGLDRVALRTRFPDRTRYAIVRGQVRPSLLPDTKTAAGMIENLSAAEVNVPMELRGAFEGVAPDSYMGSNGADKHFDAKLAFGQRLEPWLISAAGK